MCLGIVFFVFKLLVFSEHLRYENQLLSQTLSLFSQYVFKYFFCPIVSLFFS
jgi:hypothetical protein